MAKKSNLSKSVSADVKTLKSINLKLDFKEVNRLEGYVPTNKAIKLSSEILSSLMGKNSTRAFAVSAPYGSGKSSAALFWCQILEYGNKKSASLKNLFEASKKKERASGKDESSFSQWERHAPKGLAVPLVGFDGGSISGIVMAGIQAALERNGQNLMAAKVKKMPKTIEGLRLSIELVQAQSGKFDSLFIVWDEFGKVLEQVVAEGNGKAMLEIQILAEIAARSLSGTPVVFCIIMHQSFARYSSSLPAYVRNEWSKIEGRFKQINYIEDSKEIYELISQVVSRKYGPVEEKKSHFKLMAESCHKIGIFKEFDTEALTEVLWSAAPLSPVSLYLLPRVSARVAQNERTMFSYLWSAESSALPSTTKKWVTPADLFDFFKDLMRIDTSVGGAHRLWVEAQSALKKAEGSVEEDLVKALSCIKVGTSTGSLAGTPEVLDLAFGNTGLRVHSEILMGLKSLENKKSVYVRKINGEYTVWQGSDVDIRSALEEAKSKLIENLDVVKILSRDFAAPYRFPQRHNDLKCIRRYFDGRYVLPNEIELKIASEASSSDQFLDGRIYYIVAETADEIKMAHKLAASLASKQILFAVPSTPLMIQEGLTEIEAYHNLLSDPDFSKQDPIIEQELKQLTDDSEQHVRSLVSKLVNPEVNGPTFYWNGKKFDDVNSMGDLKRLLSSVCDNVFSKTPIFNNEMVNKSEPSPQIVNARKSIIRNMYDGYTKEQFGLTSYGPDVSIFRAVFLNTNLYREKKGQWYFTNQSDDLDSVGLSEVWQIGLDYWSKSSPMPKDLKGLFNKWSSPPYGVRKGIFPLLLAATFKSAGGQAQIFEDGIFVTEYKPEFFEKMLKSPQSFTIVVPELESDFLKFLDQVTSIFSNGKASIEYNDKVRRAAHALIGWMKSLPQVALEQGMCSKNIDDFLLTVRTAKEPTKLFSEGIKTVSGKSSFADVADYLVEVKATLERVEKVYFNKAKAALKNAIQVKTNSKVNIAYAEWVKSLPEIENSENRKKYLTDKKAAGFINRVEQGYPTEELFVMSLAELFSEKPLKFWNTNSFSQFEVNLIKTIRLIEDMAEEIDLQSWTSLDSRSLKDHTGRWVEKRMRGQFEKVIQRLGMKEAREFVEKIMESIEDAP